MQLLRAGVATVVDDVESVAHFPETVVCKVPSSADRTRVRLTDRPESLQQALINLACDAGARDAFGRAAWEHVRTRHALDVVARAYFEIIAQVHSDRAVGRMEPTLRGPHLRHLVKKVVCADRDEGRDGAYS